VADHTRQLQEALGLVGPNAEALRGLAEAGYMWLYKSCCDEASAVFAALTVLAPDEGIGFVGLAESELAADRARPAEEAARKASRMNADRASTAYAYVVLGRAQRARGRPKQALQSLSRAARIDRSGKVGALAHHESEQTSAALRDEPGGDR